MSDRYDRLRSVSSPPKPKKPTDKKPAAAARKTPKRLPLKTPLTAEQIQTDVLTPVLDVATHAEPDNILALLETLSDRQKRVIGHYYNRLENACYHNQVQSFLKEYPDTSYTVAAAMSSQLFRKPPVKTFTTTINELSTPDIAIRSESLSAILSQRYKQTIVHRDSQGNVIRTTEKGPSARDVVATVNELNRMTGVHDRQRAGASVAASLAKRMLSERRKAILESMRTVTPDKVSSVKQSSV